MAATPATPHLEEKQDPLGARESEHSTGHSEGRLRLDRILEEMGPDRRHGRQGRQAKQRERGKWNNLHKTHKRSPTVPGAQRSWGNSGSFREKQRLRSKSAHEEKWMLSPRTKEP